jgi:hypothetical protein
MLLEINQCVVLPCSIGRLWRTAQQLVAFGHSNDNYFRGRPSRAGGHRRLRATNFVDYSGLVTSKRSSARKKPFPVASLQLTFSGSKPAVYQSAPALRIF